MRYEVAYLPRYGYVVYRRFDDLTCTLEEMVRAHRQAQFICMSDAEEYAEFRNQKMLSGGEVTR